MEHNPSTDLMECLDQKHNHSTRESRRQHALEIIRSGVDIHSVTEYNRTCLHLAIARRFLDVAQLLVEKGIDVNAQNWRGNTALHEVCCYHEYNVQSQTELVAMLLYHGADPWIRNNRNATHLDLILKYRFPWVLRQTNVERFNLVATTVEHLYYYMFDKYTDFGLFVGALLKMAELQLPIFREIVENIKEVDVDDLATSKEVDIEHIFTMPSENLRLLLDKFDYAFIALFRLTDLNRHHRWWAEFRHENVYILAGSHLQREFIDWLCRWKLQHRFLDSLFKNDAPLASREEIVYYLLSYGMEIHGGDVETIYKYCGYNELLKLLRFMDVQRCAWGLTEIIPRLVFEVTGDIQKSIEDPQFWVKHVTDTYSKLDFETVLPYYVVPNLKDLCGDVKVEGKENFFKKLHDQPQIPLLVEMARNVFRKYFVQRLGITTAKQFYQSLELLLISPHHRKIITLETELY